MCQYIFCIGIRLQRGNLCYPNRSYFSDGLVNENINEHLSCILPGQTGTGQWVKVEGDDPVDCNNNNDNDPFGCSSSSNNPATVNLWLAQKVLPEAQEGFYKCCLPTDCSSATNTITVNIFSKKV